MKLGLRSMLFRTCLLALLLGPPSGCGEPTEPRTGSETNWLKACTSDSECGELGCVCGLCTERCTLDDDCAETGARCALADNSGLAGQCAGAPVSPGLCLRSCDETDVCEVGQLCIDGVCTETEQSRSVYAELGVVCMPDDETLASFSGFATSEVNIASLDAECGGGSCVANHFQGRTTCPYGQTAEELALPADAPARCRVPDADGSPTADPVTVPVDPWVVARRPEDAVYCSCRCSGPSDAEEEGVPPTGICACPDGMECTSPSPGLGAASYCIKTGTAFDATEPLGPVCDKNGADPATDCGGDRENP